MIYNIVEKPHSLVDVFVRNRWHQLWDAAIRPENGPGNTATTLELVVRNKTTEVKNPNWAVIDTICTIYHDNNAEEEVKNTIKLYELKYPDVFLNNGENHESQESRNQR